MSKSFSRAFAPAFVSFALLFSLCALSCATRPVPKKQNVAQNPVHVEGVGATRVEAGKEGLGMLGEEPLPSFSVGGETKSVQIEHFDVTGMPFSRAVRATVTAPGKDPWSMQLQKPTEQAIEVGDVILASFWLRAERSTQESGEGQTEFVLELAREPWSKSVNQAVRAGREWQQVHIPFQARQSFSPGEAQIIFRLGYQPQVLEIGGLSMHNFRKQLSVADLPRTKITYQGREADAPWRQAAQARIDEHRKGDLIITVKDPAGRPLPGVEVHVQQTSHAFWFGSAIVGQAVVRPEGTPYVQKITQHFNSIVLENDLKWQPLAGDWGPTWNVETAEAAIDWARKAGLRTRGHVLVWPSWKQLPNSLEKLKGDPPRLKKAVEDHVRSLATRFAGKLDHWDVLNEPYDNHDLMDILGSDVMVDWFRIAREADPQAKLYINDYSILSGGGGDSGHRKHYEETIRYLLEKGAPLDGIGMQGHFGSALTSPDDLKSILDRYAAFQRPIIVTEYDITVEDEDLAADYTRDFYTLLFSHPSVEGILMWGFFDGKHWKQDATLYDKEWHLKKSGQAYQNLVFGDFWTQGKAKTNDKGRMLVRGFLGNYQVKLASGSEVKNVELTRAGTQLELVARKP